MNERERLIKILKDNQGDSTYYMTDEAAQSITDVLLENSVVALPCKINDHVWFIKSAFSVLVKPLEARIIDIRGISIDRNILYQSITLYNDLSRSFTSNDIGTKVFLTKEEAEQAIQALKGGAE
nr:MAG TPA: hypothetical protein [Caudoviricetes sp.]